jgi:hypothetical protein
MSSATSTEAVRHGGATGNDATRVGVEGGTPASDGLRPWHFFVVCAMLAATVAVLAANDNSPGNLVMVSLAIVAAGFVGLCVHRTVWPLVSSETDEATVPLGGRARVTLEREKALVLRAIKELEFDRAMGKVADADFNEMVGRLRGRAMGLMRQLDEQRPGYRHLIEQEVRQRLGARARVPLETIRAGATAVGCPRCQTRNDVDARFCKNCGTRL